MNVARDGSFIDSGPLIPGHATMILPEIIERRDRRQTEVKGESGLKYTPHPTPTLTPTQS